MAITVAEQPSSYTPAHAPQIFRATSTQTGQPNFKYTVIITDLITSESETYEIDPRPSTADMVKDVRDFVYEFIRNYIPTNDPYKYGWQKCTDAVRKIRVNIGETYGNPPTYYAGSNIDYYVWNAGLTHWEYPTYNSANYIYTDPTDMQALSTTTDEITYQSNSSFLYFLASATPITGVKIKTYNSAGTLLGTSTIDNPYAATTDYKEMYVCIDVGYKGLSNIISMLVSGTYPIITDQVAYYDVIDTSTLFLSGDYVHKRFYVGCEARFEPYTLHYLNLAGDYRTLPMTKKSEVSIENEKQTWKQNVWEQLTKWSYNTSTPSERVLTSRSLKKYVLNSDWLSEADIDTYSDIINSGSVYLDMGNTIGLIPVIVETNSLQLLRRWNSPLKSIQLSVRLTTKDTWQNG